ncbi:hypothetical protein AHAT_15210 [Agarivorans sp. Toyoura001]|uniref:hypothetical protein n=1 Tax=Agarivorans sp. Toyoura001 TaxID=2283141 RepID=UPI0010DBF959|nr:hypothetical protein [Agarivorans sp. Toyoura001]GDY25631.1 hypothetical protein AHAT_15210 [Agarivorans sp. Toyoura001]
MKFLFSLLFFVSGIAHAANLTESQLTSWFSASKQLLPVIEQIEQENTFQDINNPSQFADEMASQLSRSSKSDEVTAILSKHDLNIESWAQTTEQVVFAAMAASTEDNMAQLEQYKTMKQELLDNPELSAEQKQQMLQMFEVSDQWITQLEAVSQSDIDLVKPHLDKFNQELGWDLDD